MIVFALWTARPGRPRDSRRDAGATFYRPDVRGNCPSRSSWAECKNYIEGIVGYRPNPYKDQELAFGTRCATFFLFPVSNPSWLSDLGEV